MLLFPFPKLPNGLNVLFGNNQLFLRKVVVFAALSHKLLCRKVLNLPSLSTAHTQLKKVVNFVQHDHFVVANLGQYVQTPPPALPV